MKRATRWKQSLVVVAGAALVVALLPMLASAQPATVSARAGGVGSQQPGIAFEPAGPLATDLDAIVKAGMTWVRADFFWASIQSGGKGSFEWGPTDAFVKAARDRGLNVLALVAYTPAWARSGKLATDPPNDPRDYANFVHAAAQRYGPRGVHAWEIWNEPNISMFWSPKADPAGYASLVKHAYPAIKSADPKAVVVSGGLAPALDTAKDLSPMTFLTGVYSHGGQGAFDAVGLHPYSFPYNPMFKAVWNTFYRTPDLHKVMAGFGDGAKAVWGTELGFPTGTSSRAVSTKEQASDLVTAIKQWRAWKFTGPLMIYTLRDSSTNTGDVNDNMGLLFADGSPKPAFSAIRRVLQP